VKYGVKTLAIAYDPKVETLAKEMGIPYLNMDSSKNKYDALFDEMENLSRWNLMEATKTKKFSWEKTGLYEALKDKDPKKRRRRI
jgi:polysaccharide pyruvyl transferase WcaK-like protein